MEANTFLYNLTNSKKNIVLNKNTEINKLMKYIGGDSILYKNIYVQNQNNSDYFSRIYMNDNSLTLEAENIVFSGNVNISGLQMSISGPLDMSCNNIIGVSGLIFCDDTYIGNSTTYSFDILTDKTLTLESGTGKDIVAKNRIYQELNSNASFNNVNGYYALAKNTYPALSRAYAYKSIKKWKFVPVNPNTWWCQIVWAPELGLFCSLDVIGPNAIISNDGINWITNTTPTSAIGLCWSKELGIFCSVGASGNRVQTSIDGLNWIENSVSPQNIDWYQVCWSPELGIFCAVGVAAAGLKRIMTSTDGNNWVLQDTPNNNETLISVIWCAELAIFCAGENSGKILYSYNGIQWYNGNVDKPGSWRNIRWSKTLGIFCAVSPLNNTPNYNVATSYDGINWIVRQTPSNAQWWGLSWSNELNIFVAVASANSVTGKVMYSYNGIDWILVPNSNYNVTMRGLEWSPELGIFCSNGTGQGGILISDLAGRIPTSYNTFDSPFNSIDSTGNWTIQQVLKSSTYTSGTTGPNVAGSNLLYITNGSATTITSLTGGTLYQPLTLVFNDGNTTLSGTGPNNIRLSGGASYISTTNSTLSLLNISGNIWIETGRSIN